jgi:hypothetical protein
VSKKRRRRGPAARASAPSTETQAEGCKLRSIPDSINFEADTGEKIVLFTHDHVGIVLFAKAEYGGEQLVPAGTATSRIEFDVLEGRNTLKMVFVFSASISGRGELREQCGDDDSQFVRALAGDEPLQLLPIVGR